MSKIGFSASLTSGNLDKLPDQLNKFKELSIDSVEIPIYEIDIIVGKKILASELKKLQSIISKYKFDYTVHGELSVNLMDEKYFDDHKEVLKKNIEVSGEIGATHLITHFGYTSINNYENKSKYEDLLKKQNECYEELSVIADKNNVNKALFMNAEINLSFLNTVPSFDMVVCTSIFHHWVRIYGKEDAFNMMRSIASKTNKYLVFETGQYNEISTRWYDELDFMGDDYEKWIIDFLTELGFNEIKVAGQFSTRLSEVKRTLFVAIKS